MVPSIRSRNLRKVPKKQLARYHAFITSHSPYFQTHSPESFGTMDKNFMMTHFNELNTLGVDRDQALEMAIRGEQTRDFTEMNGEVAVGLSSGTSGHRGVFVTTEKERSMWAAAILAKMLPKRKTCLVIALLFSYERTMNSIKPLISSLIRLEYFDIFKDSTEHLERLKQYQPTIVVAPASTLIELANYVTHQQLAIQPVKVVSVAEILEDRDAQTIAKAFQLEKVDQVYQATEGFLACTCSEGNLHLNEDILYVEKEYLDDNRFYPMITDFKRTSQPIYRYRLNDILVEDKSPCPCGSVFTRIAKIEGRSDDIFYFKKEDGSSQMIYPDFIRRCILFVENIQDYQVTQLADGSITIALSHRTESMEQAIFAQFELLAQQKQFILPSIQFIDYQWDPTRKLKRVQRLQ